MSNWEDKLRDRMEEHQETPPLDLWKDIELSLHKTSPALPILSKPNWKNRLLAFAALLLLFMSAGYFLWYNLSIVGPDNDAFALSHIPDPIDSDRANDAALYVDDTSEKSIIAPEVKNSDVGKHHKIVDKQCPSEQKDPKLLLAETSSVDSTNNQEEVKNSAAEMDKDVTVSKGTRNSTKTNESNKGEEIDRKPALLPAKKNSTSFVVVDLYASNFTSNYSNQQNLGTPSLSSNNDFGERDDLLEGAIHENNLYRDVVAKVKHKQPIRFGASVNFALNNRWSLISGLTYTKLTSDFFSGIDVYYYTGQQTLHYIGVPIYAKFNILQYNGFSFYSSAGGMLEKNVSGKLKTHYILDNKQQSFKTENIRIDQLQVSVQLALGLQYKFTSLMGIYVEPSVGYYFKNNNKIETIYQKKSLNLNLSLGLNFNF